MVTGLLGLEDADQYTPPSVVWPVEGSSKVFHYKYVFCGLSEH